MLRRGQNKLARKKIKTRLSKNLEKILFSWNSCSQAMFARPVTGTKLGFENLASHSGGMEGP